MKRQSSLLSFGFGQGSSSPPPEKRQAVDSRPETEPDTEQDASTSRRRSLPVNSFSDLHPPYDLGNVFEIAKRLSDFER